MERPADLFDRVHEWDDLVDFATGVGIGIRLALVRGRRRQGKSYLLRRLAAAVGGFSTRRWRRSGGKPWPVSGRRSALT